MKNLKNEFVLDIRDKMKWKHLLWIIDSGESYPELNALYDFNYNGGIGDFMLFHSVMTSLKDLFEAQKLNLYFIENKNKLGYNFRNNIIEASHALKTDKIEFSESYPFLPKASLNLPPKPTHVYYDWRILEYLYTYFNIKPKLSIKKELLDEVFELYHRLRFKKLPLLFTVRNNERSPERNSDFSLLIQIAKSVEHENIFIICSPEELKSIPQTLIDLPNIYLSKRYFSSVSHDMAIAYTAFMGVFSSSGMTNVALLTGKPMIVQGGGHSNSKIGAYNDKHRIFHRFNFLNDNQFIFENRASKTDFINKFNEIYLRLPNHDFVFKERARKNLYR